MAYFEGPWNVMYQHTHTSSSTLANDFASFFKDIIGKCRAQLPAYRLITVITLCLQMLDIIFLLLLDITAAFWNGLVLTLLMAHIQ